MSIVLSHPTVTYAGPWILIPCTQTSGPHIFCLPASHRQHQKKDSPPG